MKLCRLLALGLLVSLPLTTLAPGALAHGCADDSDPNCHDHYYSISNDAFCIVVLGHEVIKGKCPPPQGDRLAQPDPDARWCDDGFTVFVEGAGTYRIAEDAPPEPVPCFRAGVLTPDAILVVQIDGVLEYSVG